MQLLFLLGLQAGVSSSGKFVLEFLDTARGIHVLQLAGVKRMASIANVDANLRSSAASLESVSTTAGHFGFVVFWMNTVFHRSLCLI